MTVIETAATGRAAVEAILAIRRFDAEARIIVLTAPGDGASPIVTMRR
jgi:hypothetical protein